MTTDRDAQHPYVLNPEPFGDIDKINAGLVDKAMMRSTVPNVTGYVSMIHKKSQRRVA